MLRAAIKQHGCTFPTFSRSSLLFVCSSSRWLQALRDAAGTAAVALWPGTRIIHSEAQPGLEHESFDRSKLIREAAGAILQIATPEAILQVAPSISNCFELFVFRVCSSLCTLSSIRVSQKCYDGAGEGSSACLACASVSGEARAL